MRLNIDFSVTRPRPSARSYLLLAASIIALATVGWCGAVAWRSARVINDQLRAAQLKRAPHRVVLTPAKAEAVNRAIRQLNLPWNDLFEEIESKLTERISLLSLEPDASTSVLRIQAEAKSPEDMLDFLSSLDSRRFFHDAALVRHEVVENDRNRPIRFIAEVKWRPE